jgi:TonB family protein
MVIKNNLAIVPCIVLSIILHSAIFFAITYKKDKKNIFIQVPFDVSFYSPASPAVTEDIKVEKKVEPVKEVEPEKKKEKVVEKKKITKDDILVKKKKEKTKKQQEVHKEKAEEPKEKVVEKEQKGTEASADTQYSKGIMLENKNFKFSYYTNTILKRIRKYWQDTGTSGTLKTVVYFKINKAGYVLNVKISESSKDELFDQNALRAVELANPFPPLPENYTEDTLGVYFEFKTR